MSRKKKSLSERRKHRDRREEQREASRVASPWAPARWNFSGKVRSGEAATVDLTFSGSSVPVDLEADDPGETLVKQD